MPSSLFKALWQAERKTTRLLDLPGITQTQADGRALANATGGRNGGLQHDVRGSAVRGADCQGSLALEVAHAYANSEGFILVNLRNVGHGGDTGGDLLQLANIDRIKISRAVRHTVNLNRRTRGGLSEGCAIVIQGQAARMGAARHSGLTFRHHQAVRVADTVGQRQ